MNNILGLFRKSGNQLETGGSAGLQPADTRQCPSCKCYETKAAIRKNKSVCPHCGYHYRIGARHRIRMIADPNSFCELFDNVRPQDSLRFPNYAQKLQKAAEATGETEAVVCGTASIDGQPCALFVMDARFIMGSMGSAVGERIARLFEYAAAQQLPVIGFTASGGARMQEGILSLMQMAKVSGAVGRHSGAGGLYVTVLTDPTTGGVTASFAMQGDIILAEPKALVGFAGKRVIEQTTKRRLPADFQSAEFMLQHGFIDAIVPRARLRETLAGLLRLHAGKEAR